MLKERSSKRLGATEYPMLNVELHHKRWGNGWARRKMLGPARPRTASLNFSGDVLVKCSPLPSSHSWLHKLYNVSTMPLSLTLLGPDYFLLQNLKYALREAEKDNYPAVIHRLEETKHYLGNAPQQTVSYADLFLLLGIAYLHTKQFEDSYQHLETAYRIYHQHRETKGSAGLIKTVIFQWALKEAQARHFPVPSPSA